MKKLLFFLFLVFLFSCEKKQCICEMKFEGTTPSMFFSSESCEEFNGKSGIYIDKTGNQLSYVFICDR